MRSARLTLSCAVVATHSSKGVHEFDRAAAMRLHLAAAMCQVQPL